MRICVQCTYLFIYNIHVSGWVYVRCFCASRIGKLVKYAGQLIIQFVLFSLFRLDFILCMLFIRCLLISFTFLHFASLRDVSYLVLLTSITPTTSSISFGWSICRFILSVVWSFGWVVVSEVVNVYDVPFFSTVSSMEHCLCISFGSERILCQM